MRYSIMPVLISLFLGGQSHALSLEYIECQATDGTVFRLETGDHGLDPIVEIKRGRYLRRYHIVRSMTSSGQYTDLYSTPSGFCWSEDATLDPEHPTPE